MPNKEVTLTGINPFEN